MPLPNLDPPSAAAISAPQGPIAPKFRGAERGALASQRLIARFASKFGARELLARMRALLRRSSAKETKVVAFGDVKVDLGRRIVKKKEKEIRFTRAEYNLFTYFLKNPDRALTRDMILNLVWGYESFPNTRTVDAHVVRLRQKLETDPGTPQHFLTVHGVGYRFLP
jgi:DNA-binding response OmpR family regulator